MKQDEKIPARDASHNDTSGEHKVVKTYAEDMAEIIENDKGGLIKKIIHGEEEHEIEKRNMSPESKKNRFFMLVSLLFILVASIILFFFLFNKDINTLEIEKQFVPLIFNDKSIFIEVKDFKRDKIAQTVLNEVNTTKVKGGGVEGIYLSYDKRIVGLREFIKLIKGNFILENLTGDIHFVSDNFLLGVVNNETSPVPPASKDFFILLKVSSPADVFDALRAWEEKMFLDLHGFFGVNISEQTSYLLTKNFEDGVVENKNARILYDKDNKIVMMYIFANDTSIIITNTENATHEIMLRLASSQIKK